MMTADEVAGLLGLERHATCGFVRVTFASEQSIKPGGLAEPFNEGRPLGSALYFMVTPDAPVQLHRIRNDQLYHYYMGDPLELFLLHPGGTAERVVVGPDLRGGQQLQVLIRGNTFHTARVIGARFWFLGQAPNGLALCRPTLKAARSSGWPRNIQPLRPNYTQLPRQRATTLHRLQTGRMRDRG